MNGALEHLALPYLFLKYPTYMIEETIYYASLFADNIKIASNVKDEND